MTVGDRGFQYRIRIKTEEHFLHISYKLVFAPNTRKNTLRIEAYPKSLVYFRYWLEQIRDYANEILFVRCDVAFDIPVPINDLFTMSTKGRKLRLYKGTRYYNGKHQRQEDGYCRVYDKKRQLLETGRRKIQGEQTRMEIVYAPKEKIQLASLVQYPPQFNNKYLCAVLTDFPSLSRRWGS
jgi:hypothetical protein